MKIMRNLWTSVCMAMLALGVGAFSAPSDLSAQFRGCVHCSDCAIKILGEYEEGNIAPNGDETAIHARGRGSHGDCRPTGLCAIQHPRMLGCLEGGGGGEEERPGGEIKRASLLDEVLKSAEEGDYRAVYRLAVSQPSASGLYFLPERNAVQVRGCDDAVIVHVPLPFSPTDHVASSAAGPAGGS